MATWTVKTADKKSVEEHEIWTKDGEEIRRVTGFRWGSWTVETSDDKLPEFEFAEVPGGNGKIDSIDMNNCYGGNIESVELDSMDDGWYGDVTYPDDMDEEERERLDELWDEDSYDGWESDGWYLDETEAWIWGPLEILNQDGEVVSVINQSS